MGEIKRDCRSYVSDSEKHGCHCLIKLLCKTENKPCKFYRPEEKAAEKND